MTGAENFIVESVTDFLNRPKAAPKDMNGIKKICTAKGVEFQDWLKSLVGCSREGDLLSRVGLSIWRTILSELSSFRALSVNDFTTRLVHRIRFDRIRIRDTELPDWLELLSSTSILEVASKMTREQFATLDASDNLASWISRFLTVSTDVAEQALGLLEMAAPILRNEKVPLTIGHVYRGIVFVDVDLVETCLGLDIPFECPPGHVSLSIRNWLTSEDGNARRGSSLVNCLAHPQYGSLLRSGLLSKLQTPIDREIFANRVIGHNSVNQVLGTHIELCISRIDELGLRSVARVLKVLRFGNIAQFLEANQELRRRLLGIDFTDLLRRALWAGVFDEIGWEQLDRVADEHSPQMHPNQWHIFYRWAFPNVSLLKENEIIVCSPSDVRIFEIPMEIRRELINQIIPIDDDVLLIHLDESAIDPAKDISNRYLGTWIKNPGATKPLKRPAESVTRVVTTAQVANRVWSIGWTPFQIGDLPVSHPFESAFFDDGKIWCQQLELKSHFELALGSEAPAYPELRCFDVLLDREVEGNQPGFFQEHLQLDSKPIFEASHLFPKPSVLSETLLGSHDGKLGFFAQAKADGSTIGIGIDGRTTVRSLCKDIQKIPMLDVPLCILDKPESTGWWIVTKRHIRVHVTDEQSGEEVACFVDAGATIPGQPCEPPSIFLHLYAVRSKTTSRQLRQASYLQAKQLLSVAMDEPIDGLGLDDLRASRINAPIVESKVREFYPDAPTRLIAGIVATIALAAEGQQQIHDLCSGEIQ